MNQVQTKQLRRRVGPADGESVDRLIAARVAQVTQLSPEQKATFVAHIRANTHVEVTLVHRSSTMPRSGSRPRESRPQGRRASRRTSSRSSSRGDPPQEDEPPEPPARATCARATCGATFEPGHGRLYCTARCRNAAKAQRHRDRATAEKSQLAKKPAAAVWPGPAVRSTRNFESQPPPGVSWDRIVRTGRWAAVARSELVGLERRRSEILLVLPSANGTTSKLRAELRHVAREILELRAAVAA
jgi:hypothetical protein